MDGSDAYLIEECQKHGIPVIKKNGQMYTNNTLLKKLKTATSKMRGGAAKTDVEVRAAMSKPEAEDVEMLDTLQEELKEAVFMEAPQTSKRSKSYKATKSIKSGDLFSKKSRIHSLGKVNDELLENPLGSKLDFHVDYDMAEGQAILEDPLIQAYFNRLGISKIKDSSEMPVGLAMAVYGNHAQLGDSGLSKKLPNVLENPELREYWESKGVKKVTPQTLIPVRFLYLRE